MPHKKFSDFEYIVDQILYGNEVKTHDERDYQVKLSHEICSFVDEGLSGELFVATGGGKTKIANDSILEMLINSDDKVFLWITKDWRLIELEVTFEYLLLGEVEEDEYEIGDHYVESSDPLYSGLAKVIIYPMVKRKK